MLERGQLEKKDITPWTCNAEDSTSVYNPPVHSSQYLGISCQKLKLCLQPVGISLTNISSHTNYPLKTHFRSLATEMNVILGATSRQAYRA